MRNSQWRCDRIGGIGVRWLVRACLVASVLTGGSTRAQEVEALSAQVLGDVTTRGRNIQRTMRLLATSKPQERNTVRILFYGQSITEQAWWRLVADDLRQRFPHANLIIENRAIGGHASQLLVKTAEADLYPFQPDLVIFHVYGAHDRYEAIIRTIRERTTAEILMQNDHVNRVEDLTEETDPAKLAPQGDHWSAFMNQKWLPLVAARYDAELCDQRSIWKRYLAAHELEPSALLKDGVHLNARGEGLMAACVQSYLRYDPTLGASPAEAWVKTHEVGAALRPQEGTLRLEFQGSRVTAIAQPGEAPAADVLIDGKPPSAWPGCYTFTRTSAYPGMGWPCLLRVQSQTPLVEEEWTATLREIAPDCSSFRFQVTGSVTGEDGEGSASERFVSHSGRVVIDPDDWNLAYARRVRSEGPPPGDGFTVTWKAVLMGTDRLKASLSSQPGIETEVTLAQGLTNGPHVVELRSKGEPGVKALRVYTPPLQPPVQVERGGEPRDPSGNH